MLHLAPDGSKPQKRRIVLLLVLIAILATALTAAIIKNQNASPRAGQQLPAGRVPELDQQVIASGLNRPWDIKFLPGGELLFTQRDGLLRVIRNGQVSVVAKVNEAAFISARSEGGLTGMAVDPQFSQNRRLYLCYNSTQNDVRVSSYRVPASLDGISDRKDIVTGITANPSGRHSGCRMDFGPDGNLWIGTGDAAYGGLPQQPDSLNGKILRVSPDGQPVDGNLQPPFDRRIYSYGHRNTQGIAFFRSQQSGAFGVSSQHGPSVDDEVNELRPGNFGWAPPAGSYDESVPMTDLQAFPDAVAAIWSSGAPTQAPSGLAIIYGSAWGSLEGSVAMAMQKDEHLKLLRLDSGDNKAVQETRLLEGQYGRLRAVQLGPDGSLYISTDNGDRDQIIKLTPR